MEDSKIENTIFEIISYVRPMLEKAELDGKLDYWRIEIKNHKGDLHFRFETSDRKRVY